MVEVEYPRTAFKAPTEINQHTNVLAVKMTLGPLVTLKVAWVVQKTPMVGEFASSLWVTMGNLGKAHLTVGGLLGTDNFTEAARAPEECSLRKSASLFQAPHSVA